MNSDKSGASRELRQTPKAAVFPGEAVGGRRAGGSGSQRVLDSTLPGIYQRMCINLLPFLGLSLPTYKMMGTN